MIFHYKAEDTTAPYDLFAKNGYYKVGEKIFNHKILALQYASSKKLPITWEFNSVAYNQINWQQRLGIDIRILYKQRAQQLRNKYKYLMLGWSGGGDSTTMLYSFLHNNIPIDEVVLVWPISRSKGKYTPSLDTSSYNLISEWDYAIKPQLDQLRRNYPDLKITILDLFDKIDKGEDREDTVLIIEKHNYGSIQKYRMVDDLIRQRTHIYHDVVYLLGVSPVELVQVDNYLGAYFNDHMTAAGAKSDVMIDGVPRNIEYFYWTPDMPELVREQAHMMLDHYKMRPETIPLTLDWMKINKHTRVFDVIRKKQSAEMSRQLRKSILYQDYPTGIFQAEKPFDHHDRMETFEWVFSDPHSQEFVDPWRSCVNSHQALIDPQYFVKRNNRIVNYKIFTSRIYPIGIVPDEIIQGPLDRSTKPISI